jgi:3-hydroxyisobutyrate dehydrogenase
MKQIGFIGLGNMGQYMAKHLYENQYEVFGYDLDKTNYKKFKDNGIIMNDNISEVSLNKDIIITMLPNGSIVDKVWSDIVKAAHPDTLIVDCSTIDINTTIKIHALAKQKMMKSLDAPVSGGTVGAKDATLTFMVGGNKNAYEQMEPLFNVMGKKSILCGEAGSGQSIKMCNNLLLAITMCGLGEAMNLAESLNLSKQKFYDVISTSTGSCWALNSYCPMPNIGPNSPADNDFQPGFSSNLMLKDLSIAIEAADQTNTNLKLGKIVKNKYKEIINKNNGNLDFSTLVKET